MASGLSDAAQLLAHILLAQDARHLGQGAQVLGSGVFRARRAKIRSTGMSSIES